MRNLRPSIGWPHQSRPPTGEATCSWWPSYGATIARNQDRVPVHTGKRPHSCSETRPDRRLRSRGGQFLAFAVDRPAHTDDGCLQSTTAKQLLDVRYSPVLVVSLDRAD